MLTGILILVFMLLIMVLMVTRKMPTVIALLVLAIGMCMIAGIPFMGTDAEGAKIGFFDNVIVSGSTGLAANFVIAIFAGCEAGDRSAPSARKVSVFPQESSLSTK